MSRPPSRRAALATLNITVAPPPDPVREAIREKLLELFHHNNPYRDEVADKILAAVKPFLKDQ